jgi:hypothetical protein
MSGLTASTEHRRLDRNGGSFFHPRLHFRTERLIKSSGAGERKLRTQNEYNIEPQEILGFEQFSENKSATAVMNEGGIFMPPNALLHLYLSLSLGALSSSPCLSQPTPD